MSILSKLRSHSNISHKDRTLCTAILTLHTQNWQLHPEQRNPQAWTPGFPTLTSIHQDHQVTKLVREVRGGKLRDKLEASCPKLISHVLSCPTMLISRSWNKGRIGNLIIQLFSFPTTCRCVEVIQTIVSVVYIPLCRFNITTSDFDNQILNLIINFLCNRLSVIYFG